MPISAQQWRVVTGMNNARYVFRPARSPASPHKYISMGTLSWRACVALLQALLVLSLNTDWWGPWVGCVSSHRVREPVEKVVAHLHRTRSEGYSLVRFHVPTLRILLIVAGDVEQNPGPPKSRAVPLTLPNVTGIRDILKDSGFRVSDWESLASRLGVRDPGSIRYKYQHNAALCLEETIRQWLHIEVVTPTWEKLATEVSKVEGYGEGTKQTILRLAMEEISESVPHPVHHPVTGTTRGDQDQSQPASLTVSVLSTPAKMETLPIQHQAQTGDQDQSQPASLTVSVLSSPARTETSPIHHQAHTGAENHHLVAIAESNILEIKVKFRRLKTHVRKKLENKQVHPQEFTDFLIDLYSSRGHDFVDTVLGSAATLTDMFQALTLHGLWDYLNYHLLAYVIREFANDDHEVKEQLGDYQKELTGYILVTHIQHHLNALQNDSTTTAELDSMLFSQLCLKVNVAISDHTLAYVYDLWESLSRHCALPPPTLLLHQIAAGCISITWLIPNTLVPRTEIAVKEFGNYVERNCIREVSLDGRVIYPQQDEDGPLLDQDNVLEPEMLFPDTEHADSGERPEIMKEPDALPEVLLEQLQTKVLYRNFTQLYLHLDSPSILPKLLHNDIIDATKTENLHSFTQKYAQNFVLIIALHGTSTMSQIVFKLCDILSTTAGQEALAKRMLADYQKLAMATPFREPQYSFQTHSSDLHDLSEQFTLTLRHIISAFDHVPGALHTLKEILALLVIPLGNGSVVPLVEPQAYESSVTVRELFRRLCNHYNPLSIGLLQTLVELSKCNEAEQKLSEYTNTLASKQHLLLCIRHLPTEDQQNDLNVSAKQVISTGHKSAHGAPLEKLQSLHPTVFTHLPEHGPVSPRQATRLTVEIDRPALCLSEYADIVLSVGALFMLPTFALVYCGCSTMPLVLCWSISTAILPLIRRESSLSSYKMLAEQRVTAIAVGDDFQYKCPSIMEVEYHEACTYGLVEKIHSLLQAGVYVDATLPGYGVTALMAASLGGHTQVVELLLKSKADPNLQSTRGQTALMAASAKGHTRVVELLLEGKADSNLQRTDGDTALTVAAFCGHHSVVELLLKYKADVNLQRKDGVSALHLAAQKGDKMITKILLDAKANPNLPEETNGDTPLIAAAGKGHDKVVQALLSVGADPNYQRKDSDTALTLAASYGHHSVVELLLKYKADVNLQRKDGGSPLMLAAQGGYEGIVQLLLEAGANANLQMKGGMSSLMFAALGGHEGIVQLLLEAGAILNLQTEKGASPLMHAAVRGHQSIAQLLLDAGATPNLQMKDGRTAYDVARQKGHTELCQLLLQAKY